MTNDIIASFETTPRLTEVQIQQLFDQMGDEHFHKYVDSNVCGGGVGSGTNATILVTLDQREGGRLEGMKHEVLWYLDGALDERGIETERLDVDTIPV